MIEFCITNNILITNALFQPVDTKTQSQNDFIIMSQKLKGSVKNIRTSWMQFVTVTTSF